MFMRKRIETRLEKKINESLEYFKRAYMKDGYFRLDYGKGLGTAKLYTSGYCGFAHFGQSDLGSALMLGGMAFTIAMITYYCFIICDITSTRKKDYPNILSFILLILCFMLFIQCISRTNLMMVILMILMTFQFMRRKENEDENRNSYIYQWEQLWTKITKLRNARSL